MCPPILRSIKHDYPDVLPPPGQVRCYSFEEVFAEKLRAMGERSRPRDLYDIVNLFRRTDLHPYANLVLEVLEQKCESKGVPVPSVMNIRSSPMFEELKSEWENMLAHQLRALPAFDHFWAEVPRIFAWLDGADPVEELESWLLGDGEDFWTPPPTFWTGGLGSLLEPVRFAAVNHLLFDLGYRGKGRLIEPYSLRQTRDGHVLLHAIHSSDGGNRSYRVDRIESVHVSHHPFTPRFVVEFPASGTVLAPHKGKAPEPLNVCYALPCLREAVPPCASEHTLAAPQRTCWHLELLREGQALWRVSNDPSSLARPAVPASCSVPLCPS